MKPLLLVLAVILSSYSFAQNNQITVSGSAKRDIRPDNIVLNVHLNDENCSPEYPNIEAITAKYISITKSIGVIAANNVLIKQRQKQEGDRTYSFHTYKLILNSEEDLEIFSNSLAIDPEYYNVTQSTFSYDIVSKSYPNQAAVETEVRELAFQNAKISAEHLAKLAGKKLGPITEIYEPDNSTFMYGTGEESSLSTSTRTVSFLIRLTYSLLP